MVGSVVGSFQDKPRDPTGRVGVSLPAPATPLKFLIDFMMQQNFSDTVIWGWFEQKGCRSTLPGPGVSPLDTGDWEFQPTLSKE